jgi:hypothetical protein
MENEFKITPQMTKKEIMDRYLELLEEFKKRAREAEEVQKWRKEAEKHREAVALESAKKATVEGVIDSVGNLRILLGKTLTDLSEKLTSRAERLEELNQAVAIQGERLKELYDIEAATDTFHKLMAAYEEQVKGVEEEFEAGLAQLEKEYGEKTKELRERYEAEKATLEKEIAETRQAWEEEKQRRKLEWEREEEEYLYLRDKRRKQEEDEYHAKKSALEKELEERREKVTRELNEREAAISAREEELDNLRRQVEQFPEILKKGGIADLEVQNRIM